MTLAEEIMIWFSEDRLWKVHFHSYVWAAIRSRVSRRWQIIDKNSVNVWLMFICIGQGAPTLANIQYW